MTARRTDAKSADVDSFNCHGPQCYGTANRPSSNASITLARVEAQ